MKVAQLRGCQFYRCRGEWQPKMKDFSLALNCLEEVAQAIGYSGSDTYNSDCLVQPEVVLARLAVL